VAWVICRQQQTNRTTQFLEEVCGLWQTTDEAAGHVNGDRRDSHDGDVQPTNSMQKNTRGTRPPRDVFVQADSCSSPQLGPIFTVVSTIVTFLLLLLMLRATASGTTSRSETGGKHIAVVTLLLGQASCRPTNAHTTAATGREEAGAMIRASRPHRRSQPTSPLPVLQVLDKHSRGSACRRSTSV
jgi:hypothetical protein